MFTANEFECKGRSDWESYPFEQAIKAQFGAIGPGRIRVGSLDGGDGVSLMEAHHQIGEPFQFTLVGGNGTVECRVG